VRLKTTKLQEMKPSSRAVTHIVERSANNTLQVCRMLHKCKNNEIDAIQAMNRSLEQAH
jgi:hypothetical protein